MVVSSQKMNSSSRSSATTSPNMAPAKARSWAPKPPRSSSFSLKYRAQYTSTSEPTPSTRRDITQARASIRKASSRWRPGIHGTTSATAPSPE
jgi:hypothetical protein